VDDTRRSGSLTLAAALLILAGALNVVAGIEALHAGKADFPRLMYTNFDVWGIIFLAWGAAQIIAGVAAFARQPFGLTLGLVLAGVGAVIWFFFLLSAPVEAAVGGALNLFVLWALVQEGRRTGLIGDS
jgi:hypothetical protein